LKEGEGITAAGRGLVAEGGERGGEDVMEGGETCHVCLAVGRRMESDEKVLQILFFSIFLPSFSANIYSFSLFIQQL